MSVTAAQVANAFIHFHIKDMKGDEVLPPLDRMKLDKMVYYAQAHWLGRGNEELFNDCQIVAEDNGPVIDGLPNVAELGNGSIDGLPDMTKKFLRGVHNALKHWTGSGLSDETHKPGEPWHFVWKAHNGDLSSRPVIPLDLIRSVFVVKIFQIKQHA